MRPFYCEYGVRTTSERYGGRIIALFFLCDQQVLADYIIRLLQLEVVIAAQHSKLKSS